MSIISFMSEAPWDDDVDGIFGERRDDMVLVDARESQLAPGRVPVSHEEEIAAYTAKVEEFTGDLYGRLIHPLLVSDIAAFIPFIGDVNDRRLSRSPLTNFFPGITGGSSCAESLRGGRPSEPRR